MPHYKFLVAENRIVECAYIVEADSPEEARDAAESGETVSETDLKDQGVNNRTVLECFGEVPADAEHVKLGSVPSVTVHSDWRADGIEEDEDLWRLDLDDNETQIQLFAEVEDEDPMTPSYTGCCRLFIEVDRRDESGDKRIHYAGHEWLNIPPEEAASLLAKPKAEVVAALNSKIAEVKALPCDKSMLN